MPPAGTHDRSPRILRTGTGSCQAGTRTPIPSEASSGNRGKITRPDVDLCSSQTTIQQSWQLASLNRKEKQMKFMLISYASKEWEVGLPPDPKLLAAIPRLHERMPKGGALHSTGGLAPSSAGAKVRVSGGIVVVTDGPFAETKEIVGGFAIVDVGSKEEAIAIAKEFWQLHVDVLGHSFEGGGEIRPMFHQEQCAPPDQPVGEQEAIVEYIRYRIPSDRCA